MDDELTMPDREKLIELSRQLRYCAVDDCLNCERWKVDCGSRHCGDDLMLKAAELLESIANGATILTEPKCEKINIKLPKEIVVHSYGDKWIPVTERLPEKDAGKVLVVKQYRGKPYIDIGEVIEGRFFCYLVSALSDVYRINRTEHKFTHWMPLPPAPEGE